MTRIGSSRPLQVDVRIVAATNEHLPRLVEEGRFRADLLDRLSFEVVTLPPLRNRAERHPGPRRLSSAAAWRSSSSWDAWPGFSEEAMARLQAYAWPGNVRELRNVVERAVYRWDGQEGPIEDIQFDPFESPWRPLSGQGVLAPRRQPAPTPPVPPTTTPTQRQPSATPSRGFDPERLRRLPPRRRRI